MMGLAILFLGAIPSQSDTLLPVSDPARSHLQVSDSESSGPDGEPAETDTAELGDRTLHPGPETETQPGSTLEVGKTPLADALVAIFQLFGGGFRTERDGPRGDGPWR